MSPGEQHDDGSRVEARKELLDLLGEASDNVAELAAAIRENSEAMLKAARYFAGVLAMEMEDDEDEEAGGVEGFVDGLLRGAERARKRLMRKDQ